MDATPAISTAEAIVRGPSSAGSFEFTPTMLGPALTEDMLTLADEDIAPLIMPELEIRALPPVDDEATPPG